MPNNDCLFCQIVAGEIPSNKIYETDNVIAFLDINPVNPGHTLVVPKKHSENMLDADDAVLQEMIVVTKKVSQAILENFTEYNAFNLELNNGQIAGQVIPHLHWHIIPRTEDDGLKHWPGKSYQGDEARIVQEKLKNALK